MPEPVTAIFQRISVRVQVQYSGRPEGSVRLELQGKIPVFGNGTFNSHTTCLEGSWFPLLCKKNKEKNVSKAFDCESRTAKFVKSALAKLKKKLFIK